MKDVKGTVYWCERCNMILDVDSYELHDSRHRITKVEVSTGNSVAEVLRDMLMELRRLNDNLDRVSVSDHGAILTKRDE